MTAVKSLIKKNTFYDSLTLMRVSRSASELEDVVQAAAVMASDINKEILSDVGLLTDQVKHATANDLVISILTKTDSAAESAILAIEKMLVEVKSPRTTKVIAKTLESALEQLPDANLVMISVPGSFAKLEAKKALEKGLNVLLFSDGVSLEDELELKKIARNKDLLMMGPGCGTAMINGVGLGFANAVKKGPIGIVGAAGTGIQQVTTLIDQGGSGVSQAIGTGGRDLSDDIGGIMMIKGIETLENDMETKVIILISKPPGPETEKAILKTNWTKPTVVCFIGGESTTIKSRTVVSVETLEEASMTAIALLRNERSKKVTFSLPNNEILNIAKREWDKIKPQQKYTRGLYSGGTLCSESFLILSKLLVNVYSNVTKSEFKLTNVKNSREHTCLDMGEEEFTTNRAHPMIDPLLRQQRLVNEAKDPECAVILLDVVLGYGSHIDPAGELAKSIKEAKSMCEKEGRYLSVVASVIGTDKDPQGLKNQVNKLVDVGVVVMASNAQAARMAALISTRGKVAQEFWRDNGIENN
jgi:succinyl-CoA synthetase alpha subunit